MTSGPCAAKRRPQNTRDPNCILSDQTSDRPDLKAVDTPSARPLVTVDHALVQRLNRLEDVVEYQRRDLHEIERQLSDLMRTRILAYAERLSALDANQKQLIARYQDYATALQMLQDKSEAIRGDAADTELRLLQRIQSDAKDRRHLITALMTSLLSTVAAIIYAVAGKGAP